MGGWGARCEELKVFGTWYVEDNSIGRKKRYDGVCWINGYQVSFPVFHIESVGCSFDRDYWCWFTGLDQFLETDVGEGVITELDSGTRLDF